MTNIGHFRTTANLFEASGESIPTRFWLALQTKMDEQQLMEEGVCKVCASSGARTKISVCSLWMGIVARSSAGSAAVTLSTTSFSNRLRQGSDVFLSSPDLTAISAVMGKLSTVLIFYYCSDTLFAFMAKLSGISIPLEFAMKSLIQRSHFLLEKIGMS